MSCSPPENLRLAVAERVLAARHRLWPLSLAQQRLWFLHQLEPGTATYNMPSVVRLRGSLHLPALEKALDAILQRHEILRTRFITEDGEPFQLVDHAVHFSLEVADLSSHPENAREQELGRLLQREGNRPFDLAIDRLVRAAVFRMGPQDHVLLINMHHIVSDEWSFDLFYRELRRGYRAFLAGCDDNFLPPLAVQYRDYATWQRDWMKSPAFEEELAYWKEQLGDNPPPVELPTDRLRTLSIKPRGAARWHGLGPELSHELKQLARQQRVTLFMLLLASWKTLLFHYTRQPEIVVGCPVAGRTNTETEELIGFFVNTLALRTSLVPQEPFLQLLSRVREVVLGAFSHQNLPFDKLVQVLQPERSANSTPFVNVMFFLQHALAGKLDLPALDVQFMDPGCPTAKFDLTLAIQETATELVVVSQYNAALFDSETVARLLHHYAALLEKIVQRPTDALSQFSLLDDAEAGRLLIEWNGSHTPFPRHATIHELFYEQVRQVPDAVAIVFSGFSLTYRELDERSNQVCRALKRFGIGTGCIVAFVADRSLELVIGLLGILKAGAGYAAIDISLPEQRTALLLDELSPAAILLAHNGLLAAMPALGQQHFFARPRICLDSEFVLGQPRESVDTPTKPLDLAYVSFTSGTTGKPKGVCVPHRAVVRLVRNTNYVQFSPNDSFLQLAPLAFDASTFEIWAPLLNGARLVIMPPGTPSLSELACVIKEQRVTIAWFTSGLFNHIIDERPEALEPLKQVLTGGDVLSPVHVQKALSLLPSCRIINGYGPTENTTFTCSYTVPADFDGQHSVPIGKPISNTHCYVLDPWLKPVPVGLPGELYCGGDGLADGYLKAPELTREKFIQNPFEPGARLYKTGDLVRYRPDGNLQFIGRIDSQLKIRGFRVELDEIQSVLMAHPDIRDCAVVSFPDPSGSRQLAAYFVAGNRAASSFELQQFLRARLPEYMIPAFFLPVAKLPLCRNGKLDRAALPMPERSAQDSCRPRDSIEQKLATIWEAVLEVSPIGIHDKFFALGGHSLLAIRLLARVEKEFGQSLSVAALFQNPTIARLASCLRHSELSPKTTFSVVEIQPHGSRRPLFLVHGVGGGMFWGYNNLARALGGDQPLFGFQSRGLDGEPEFEQIEEMARHYVRELQTVQPVGPYYLGGYCFGGVVAYEMACQLHEAGEQVARLFLINSNPPNSSYTTFQWTPRLTCRFVGNLLSRAALSFALPPRYRREFVRRNACLLANRVRRVFDKDCSCGPALDELLNTTQYTSRQQQVWETHVRALANYRPRQYPGPLMLFRSRVHHLFCSFDPACGWREFARGGVDLHIIPGAHETVMDEPYVRELARQVRRALVNGSTLDTGSVAATRLRPTEKLTAA